MVHSHVIRFKGHSHCSSVANFSIVSKSLKFSYSS